MALAEAGIRLYGGVSWLADMAVSAYLGGTLAYSSDEVRTDAPPSPTTYQIINRRACAERILWIKEIKIDEGGVSGAAYTEIRMEDAAPGKITEKLTFRADRPFIYAVTGPDGSILFAGIVWDLP